VVLVVVVVFRLRADSKAAAAILCQKYRETWTGVQSVRYLPCVGLNNGTKQWD
jgi:hypothetical protein